MHVKENKDLSKLTTMRLGGKAKYLAEVSNREELEEAVTWAVEHKVPPLMIGGGSNIIWRDEGFDGMVLINKIMGYEDTPDGDVHVIKIGAGENWDKVVAKAVSGGLSGIEALSLIPGTAGATPIQNVGAYGQEISDSLVSVEAYDLHTLAWVTIPGSACGFGYRTSRFKTTDRDRFLISHITLRLTKKNPTPPFYRALADYFNERKITSFTPFIVRKAVIDIRSSKLPDPHKVANNGSFFANPVVDTETAKRLLIENPNMPVWPDESGLSKIPAAWLIEQAGFKDHHDKETGMATWHKQPLVLVNEHAKTTADLLKFKAKIVDAVSAKFGITLVQEPELLP